MFLQLSIPYVKRTFIARDKVSALFGSESGLTSPGRCPDYIQRIQCITSADGRSCWKVTRDKEKNGKFKSYVIAKS